MGGSPAGRPGGSPSSPPSRSSGSGFALLAVLLALLILTGLIHGTLALGRFHAYASLAEGRAVAARAAAQSGVRAVAGDLTRDLPLAESGELRRTVALGSASRVDVSVRKLVPEWLWIEGEARVGAEAGQGVHRAGAAYWSLDPAVRVGALTATVELGEELSMASSESITPLHSGSLDPGYGRGICDPEETTDPRLGRGSKPAVAALADEGDAASPHGPSLGLLGWRELAARGERGVTPERAGEVRVIEGAFVVPVEGIRGVLVVSGDLEIPDARELVGLALVGGSLTVRDDGRLVGAARVGASVVVRDQGRILGSRCAVFHFLREHPELSSPLPAPDGTWFRIP